MKIKIVKDSNRLTGDLSKKTCLVIDVFRATTTIPFLLNNKIKTLFISDGYKNINQNWLNNKNYILFSDKKLRKNFDNSPFEALFNDFGFKNIILISKNGTKVINKLREANNVYCGSFVNFFAMIQYLKKKKLKELLIFPVGNTITKKENLEDNVCAFAYKEFLKKKKFDVKKINKKIQKAIRKRITFKATNKQKEMKLYMDLIISSKTNLTDTIPIIKFKKKYITCEKI